MNEFAGKVAVVTGAAQGIGRATAQILAASGAQVVVADIQAERGEAVAEEIRQAGGTARFTDADMGRHAAIRELIEGTVTAWGRLDFFVNNAYWAVRHDVIELDEADWDKGMNVMLKAIYLSGKYAFPAMQATGGGAMVNIASIHSYAAHYHYPMYAAAKAGVINLTKQMAIDFGRYNIRVNAVCPGWIITEVAEPRPAALARASKMYPLGRPGRPHDIAKVVRFLLSDDAGFVTGHALVVDGGLTAQLQDAVPFAMDGRDTPPTASASTPGRVGD